MTELTRLCDNPIIREDSSRIVKDILDDFHTQVHVHIPLLHVYIPLLHVHIPLLHVHNTIITCT